MPSDTQSPLSPDNQTSLRTDTRSVSANFGSDAPYSITSSAVASSEGGTLRPKALAVFRLIANLKRGGCSTGISAGLGPLNILWTSAAARWEKSGKSCPYDGI